MEVKYVADIWREASIFAILNLILSFQNKDSTRLGFASISLTALNVCSFYHDAAARVVNQDWGDLWIYCRQLAKHYGFA